MSHSHDLILLKTYYGTPPPGESVDLQIVVIQRLNEQVSEVKCQFAGNTETQSVLCFNNHLFKPDTHYVTTIYPMRINADLLNLESKYSGNFQFISDMSQVSGIDVENNKITIP